MKIANKTSDTKMDEKRKLVHIDLKRKFLPVERNSNEETCEPNVPDYAYDYTTADYGSSESQRSRV